MRRSRVIQIMFDTKSGGRAQRLYVSKITCECAAAAFSTQAAQAKELIFCSPVFQGYLVLIV